MPKRYTAQAQIDEALHSFLEEVAMEREFEGVQSRVVRRALEEFRDRRLRPGAASRAAESSDQSS